MFEGCGGGCFEETFRRIRMSIRPIQQDKQSEVVQNQLLRCMCELNKENEELKQRIERMEHNARCVLDEREDEKIDDPVFALSVLFTYGKELLSKVANAKDEKDAYDLCVTLRNFLGK